MLREGVREKERERRGGYIHREGEIGGRERREREREIEGEREKGWIYI